MAPLKCWPGIGLLDVTQVRAPDLVDTAPYQEIILGYGSEDGRSVNE